MSQPLIVVPKEGEGLIVVASVSGGKDSTALILALREAEIPARYVFADTGWEATETYAYLGTLRERLGIEIDVVRAQPKADAGDVARVYARIVELLGLPEDAEVPGLPKTSAMLDRCVWRSGFPGRMQRWCTREIKIEPLRAYHDILIDEAGMETVSAMGVRSDESPERANMPEWADEPTGDRSWGGFVWRPLICWSIPDVLLIHQRHSIPVNPLYLRGFGRVGCFPCIYEAKEGIRLLPPSRVDVVRALETAVTELRARRNAEEPGRYAHDEATFFQTARKGFSGIDKVAEWARTDRGGRQFPLFAPAPRGGCMKWGLCETGPEDTEGETDG